MQDKRLHLDQSVFAAFARVLTDSIVPTKECEMKFWAVVSDAASTDQLVVRGIIYAETREPKTRQCCIHPTLGRNPFADVAAQIAGLMPSGVALVPFSGDVHAMFADGRPCTVEIDGFVERRPRAA